MKIVLRVENNVTYIDGKLPSKIYQGLKKALGYIPPDSFWMIKRNSEKNKNQKWRQNWDGTITTVHYSKKHCKCNVKKEGTHFPTGLLHKAIKYLNQNGVKVVAKDCRPKVESTRKLQMSPDFEARDYQDKIIKEACKKDRGIIKLSTGGGKTAIASAIIANRGIIPVVFYVTSVDLLTQAKSELEKFIYDETGENIVVGEVGGGRRNIQEITVMTIQTAVRALGGVWKKYDDEDTKKEKDDIGDFKEEVRQLIRNANLIICDEVQHWAAETCQIISDNSFNAKYRLGLSATPFRDLGDDILIEGCFSEPIVDVNASKLIKKKYLVQPKIRFYNISNMRGKFTTKPKIGEKNKQKANYANVYKEAIVENSLRNNIIATIANDLIKENRSILILVKQIAHGEILEKLIDGAVFLHGEHSSKEREEHLDKMRRGESNITISSSIFDEGVDCKPLDTLILAGSGKSSTRALQRIGRVLRPYTYPDGRKKEDAIVVDFMDNVIYLKAHSEKRLKIYKTEPLFDVKVQ